MHTQEDRDKEFFAHKPYAGFAYRQNLASFRRAKTWIGRPFPPGEEDVDQAEEEPSDAECEEPQFLSVHHEDLLAMDQPVASSSRTPTYEQPNPFVEHPQTKFGSSPSRFTLPETPSQGKSEVTINRNMLTAIKTSRPPLRPHFPPTMVQYLPNVCSLPPFLLLPTLTTSALL